jgi:hypothetical protein
VSELGLDENGYPIMLATTAAGGTAPGTEPAPRRRSNGKPQARSIAKPAGVDAAQWSRRMDAVRDAAREFEDFSAQDVKEWLVGRTNRQLTDAEIQQFVADVRRVQIDDLVDILDRNERGKLRGRRHVRVVAPKGYTRKVMNSLSTQELQDLARRLRTRGWDEKQLEALRSKVPEAKRSVLDGLAEEPGPEIVF